MFKKLSIAFLIGLLFLGAYLGMKNEPNEVAAGILSHTPLLTNDRDNLEICVESKVPSVATQKAERIIDKLVKEKVTEHKKWNKLYGSYDFEVTSNCEIEPYLLQKGAEHPILSGNNNPGRIVEKANPARVTVHIVPEKEKNSHFGDSKLLTAPEEIICEKNQCFEVTTGVYLSPNELANISKVNKGLLQALALEPLQIPNHEGPTNRE